MEKDSKVKEIDSDKELTKKRNRVLIILGVILVVFIIMKISKSIGFKDPFDDVDNLIQNSTSITSKKEKSSFSEKLDEDYKNGKLSDNDYMLQYSYLLFDNDKINSNYKSLDHSGYDATEFIEKFKGMYDKLDDKTLKYIFEKLSLSDVEWGIEEDPEVQNMSLTGSAEVQFMKNDSDINKLDHVILSKNGNFLVYYMTSGRSAIKDKDASKIADVLENSVVNYKTKFNLDYKYSIQYDHFSENTFIKCPVGTSKAKACSLLKENNIDLKYIDTAMPVYIIDIPSDLGGFYVPYFTDVQQVYLKATSLFEDYAVNIDSAITTYAFPFFVVNSSLNDFDSTKLIASHELFHHYQHYLCGNGEYAQCKSGNFTIESGANYASISINDVDRVNTLMNRQAACYVDDVELGIDQACDGYGGYLFLYNYSNTVDNGVSHVFESLKHENALYYLADASGGKFKDVLIDTAIKNLTLNYNNNQLFSYRDSNVIYPGAHKVIGYNNTKLSNSINYSSMHYYYIQPKKYGEKAQISFSGSSSDLTLLLFVKEGSSYKHLYTHTLNNEFTIHVDDFNNFDEIAIALVNSKTNETLRYYYELDNNGTKVPTVTAESLNLKKIERNVDDFNSFMCYQVEDNSTYNVITQLKLSFNRKDKINDMYYKGTIRLKNYDANDPAYKTAKNIVSGAFRLMQIAYKEQFKNFKVITEEQDDRYMITFKITKNYYDALNNSMKIKGQTKHDIIKEIEANGFTCNYSK